jgi:hypothetical protein
LAKLAEDLKKVGLEDESSESFEHAHTTGQAKPDKVQPDNVMSDL